LNSLRGDWLAQWNHDGEFAALAWDGSDFNLAVMFFNDTKTDRQS
jgi:hypothetical protein